MARSARPILLTLAACALCCAAIFAATLYRAQHAWHQAERQTATHSGISFDLRPLDLHAHPSLFQPVAARPAYTSVAELAGTFYLAGPAGLTIANPDGSSPIVLRTGIELPAAPIAAIITGRLRGAAEPQILLPTAGAGVLILQPQPHGLPLVTQLLPARPDLAQISALALTPAGDLLLGTPGAGVFVFTGGTLKPLGLPGTGKLAVTSIAVVDAASLLIGTRTQGVFYTHAGTLQHAGTAEGLPDEQVEAIAVAESRAYVGTPLGVAEFVLPSEAFHPTRTIAPGLFAHALALSAGHLLIGTVDQGVQQVALDTRPSLRPASFVPSSGQGSERIAQLLPVKGALFSLADGRLERRTATGWQPATPAPAGAGLLTDRNIAALAFDSNGALFIGYFDRGLDILQPGGDLRHLEDDSLFCINRLALDPHRNTIAAATANGLVLFDTDARPRQTLTRRDGLLSNHITDLAFTRTGTVLATPAGLTYLTATGAESLYAFQGLVNNHVYALAADPATDHVLAGTLGGLSLLDSASVRASLTVANSGLRHNWITALAASAHSGSPDWLIGTYGAGLQRLSAQGIVTPVELPANAPRDLVINPNALLVTSTHAYAGTLGHGLLVYTAATGNWRLLTEGLPSLNVTAFAARAGQLYIGTQNGLVRLPEASL